MDHPCRPGFPNSLSGVCLTSSQCCYFLCKRRILLLIYRLVETNMVPLDGLEFDSRRKETRPSEWYRFGRINRLDQKLMMVECSRFAHRHIFLCKMNIITMQFHFICSHLSFTFSLLNKYQHFFYFSYFSLLIEPSEVEFDEKFQRSIWFSKSISLLLLKSDSKLKQSMII